MNVFGLEVLKIKNINKHINYYLFLNKYIYVDVSFVWGVKVLLSVDVIVLFSLEVDSLFDSETNEWSINVLVFLLGQFRSTEFGEILNTTS